MARKKAKALPPKTITVYAEILQETDDAILVRCDEDADGVWLPKSRINFDGERGDTGVEIEIPDRLADEKGFFDGMGRAEAPVVPAEPAPEPLPEPEHECGTCKHTPFGGATRCDSRNQCDADTLSGWEPATEPRCETCSHYGADYPDVCDTCPDGPDSLANWKPSHPCFAAPVTLETPAGKRAFGDNVKWLKEEPITVSMPLSEAEKARYAEEMAALDKEIEELEDERSDVSSRLKKQIDAKEQERREMSAHVNDGELRTISCDCLKDYNTGEMVWTNAYPPYEEVRRRKMTKEEMQPSLLEYAEKTEKTVPAMDFDTLAELAAAEGDAFTVDDAAEYELDRSCENCRHSGADGTICGGPEDCISPDLAGWEPIPQADATDGAAPGPC